MGKKEAIAFEVLDLIALLLRVTEAANNDDLEAANRYRAEVGNRTAATHSRLVDLIAELEAEKAGSGPVENP